MSDEAGGRGTSTVPGGIVGTSSVLGAETCEAIVEMVVTAMVELTTAGCSITPIVGETVGGVLESGSRSSSPREKPHTTRPAASSTAAVDPIRIRRERRRDCMLSATQRTLTPASTRLPSS